MLEIKETETVQMPRICVIGIGGGGNNAVDRMIEAGLEHVEFINVNTDYQVLESSSAQNKLQIGKKLTGGFGAGADPTIGEASAKESEESILSTVTGANMVILTCGLGGGTGTGAIPVIAEICHNAGILTVAVVTIPFSFEGLVKQQLALSGLENLKKNVDTLLVIPNDKLLTLSEKSFYLDDAFTLADNVLKYTIEGITNIIFNRGMINLDFNDVKTTLVGKGLAHLGIGTISKDGSIIDAVKQAIDSPLLDTDISSATNILLNTSGRINLMELNEAVSYVREITNASVNIIWGTVTDTTAADSIIVTLIATGLEDTHKTVSTHGPVTASAPSASGNTNNVIKATPLEIPIFLKRYANRK